MTTTWETLKIPFWLFFVTCVMTPILADQPILCNDDSTCPEYAACDKSRSTCKCWNGFYFNNTLGECEAMFPCTTVLHCSETCAQADGRDQCFCSRGQVLASDGKSCETRKTYFFRLDLDEPFLSSNEKAFFSALARFMREELSAQHLHPDNITGAEFLYKSNGGKTVVIMQVDFKDFTPFNMPSLELSVGNIIRIAQFNVDMQTSPVTILRTDLYESMEEAVNDDNPKDVKMCSQGPVCKYIAETCVDLRGTAYQCIVQSLHSRFFRGIIKIPYDERIFYELFTNIANLTERFLRDGSLFYTPIKLLAFLPGSKKEYTIFIVYMDVYVDFRRFQSSFIEHFVLKTTKISIQGSLVEVKNVQMYSAADFAVADIFHMPIRLCGTKYSHCPRWVTCVDHYDGTYECKRTSFQSHSLVHFGFWRALLTIPYTGDMAGNISHTASEKIQAILQDDLFLGQVTVNVVDFGDEYGLTYTVIKIGFDIQSYHLQKTLIHHGFVLHEQKFKLLNDDTTTSTHGFKYVKSYTSLSAALKGGIGEIINEGCQQNPCPNGGQCIATDFRHRCEPFCQQGYYANGDSCESCGPGMTTFYSGTHSKDLCVLPCPENQEYSIYTMECEDCPEHFFSPEGDPRCYFCHSSIENGTKCDQETVSKGLDDVVDIRMKITASYAFCVHVDEGDRETEHLNVTEFIMKLVTSHYNDPIYNGICFMTYAGRTGVHCENAVTELESEACEPDESCIPDRPCQKFNTNFTITFYNTLSKYAIVGGTYAEKIGYMQSAVSSIGESLFDHSQLYRSFRGSLLQLEITIHGEPEVTHLSKQDAENRHLYIGIFYKDGFDSHFAHELLKFELSKHLARMIPDFLYFQVEASWNIGSHLDNLMHFALVFKDGADESKINVTAEILLSMHDSVGGTTRNMSLLTGPMSIHMSADAAVNTVDWCAVREQMGIPHYCPHQRECHNYHVYDKSHELVECSAPGISKVFGWAVLDKPYNAEDDETVGTHMVESIIKNGNSHGFQANVSYLDVRQYFDGETLIIVELDFSKSLSDRELIGMSIFAYQYFIVSHHTVHLTDTKAYNVSFFEVFLTKEDAWHGVNALVHPLCNETLTGFKVCSNDSECVDTNRGPVCTVLCKPGMYHDGSNCLHCPDGMTTLIWGAESLQECVEQCKDNAGFEYQPYRCVACSPGFMSDADQQFCFHEISSEVSLVDIKIQVNVSFNNCDDAIHFTPYDIDIGSSRVVKDIFLSKKHGYILSGLCNPEDSCDNVKVHVKDEDGMIICRPHPSCNDHHDCNKYQMVFIIDILGADNQVLVHGTDTYRRSTTEVVLESLAFALHKTPNPSQMIKYGTMFEYETAEIQVKNATKQG